MSSLTPNTALVVGATGIAGHALSRLLVDAGWEVLGLSRRGATDVRGVVPVQADLTDAAGLRDALAGHRPTHVFVTAWARQDTEEENIRVNGGMVRDLLAALSPGGSVRHVALSGRDPAARAIDQDLRRAGGSARTTSPIPSPE